MDLPIVYYNKNEYLETSSGNRLCKIHSTKGNRLFGTHNIVLNGKCILKTDAVLRADIGGIRIGYYCIILERSIIRPSHKVLPKGAQPFPTHIGDHVFIEEDCVVAAGQISSYVHIGAGSIIGKCAIIKECCRVLPGSVVPADTIFPPFCTIAGNPAKIVGREPDCTPQLMTDATKQFYDNFVSSDKQHVSLMY